MVEIRNKLTKKVEQVKIDADIAVSIQAGLRER
jgi:hypothetical protein